MILYTSEQTHYFTIELTVSVYGVPDMVATRRNDATADQLDVHKLQQWTVDIKLVVSTPEIR